MKIQYILTLDVRDMVKDDEHFTLTEPPKDAAVEAWLKRCVGRDRDMSALGDSNWLAGVTVTPVKPL